MDVESTIEIPTERRSKYPWAKMKVGDSFFVNEHRRNVAAAACGWVKRHGNDRKFTTRSVEGGVRVWRVK